VQFIYFSPSTAFSREPVAEKRPPCWWRYHQQGDGKEVRADAFDPNDDQWNRCYDRGQTSRWGYRSRDKIH
jgi:hypothetical protein